MLIQSAVAYSRIIAGVLFLTGLFAFVPAGPVYAQVDQEVQSVKKQLIGKRVVYSFRQGGVLNGTFVFQEIHLCRTGRYLFFEQRRKQTVLGNEQVTNRSDRGRWDVIRTRGQVGLGYRSDSGGRGFIPVVVGLNGRVQLAGGGSFAGRAQC